MSTDLNRREVLQGAVAAGRGGRLGAGRLAARDFAGVKSWTSAPCARLAHPSAEHFPPLIFPDSSLSMRSFALRG